MVLVKKRVAARNDKAKKMDSLKGIETIDRVLTWVFILAVGLLPVLVIHKVNLFVAPRIEYDILNTRITSEFFVYCKWAFLIFLSITALALLLVKIFAFRFEIRRSYINIPLLILAAITLLSGLTAEHPGISLFGVADRYEGTLTSLCYLALFFVAANTGFKKNIGSYITAALCFFALINTATILFDFYGKDFYQNSQSFKSFILPQGLPQQLTPGGKLNSTLGNPNYISGISCALIAFFLTAALLIENLRKRLVYILFSAASFAMLLASLSTSGFVSLLAVLPVIAIITYLKSEHRLHTLAIAGTALISYILIFTVLFSHNPNVWNETMGFFKSVDLKKESDLAPGTDTNQFSIEKKVATTSSGRIYIWRKTLDLVKEKPVLGHGPDTLGYYFPQGDPLRTRYLGITELVDKPHNMYLGTAFGSGLVALAALACLFLLHFYRTARMLVKSTKSGSEIYFPAALFTFWCAFLIQWLFNDSIIGTSAIFWTLFGLAVSLNGEFNEL